MDVVTPTPLFPGFEAPIATLVALTIEVHGPPVPQGSMRAFARNGHAWATSDNPRTRPWKAAVTAEAARAVEAQGLEAPAYGREAVGVQITFRLARPKGHYGARGNLLPSAPKYPAVLPDIDKLTRAILDALTGVVYRDDAQVVTLGVEKRYADGDLVTTIGVGPAL